MKLLAPILLLSALFALPAQGSRLTSAPRFSWHDWYQLDNWCDGTDPSRAFFKNLEISISNISPISQTITVSCVPSSFNGASSVTANSQPLNMHTALNGSQYGDTSTPVVTTFTLGANSSTMVICGAMYRGPNGGGNYGGDWHLYGAYDIKFTVAEDRGAVNAVINSVIENTCVNFSNDTISLSMSALRDTSRTVLVNGGRAF